MRKNKLFVLSALQISIAVAPCFGAAVAKSTAPAQVPVSTATAKTSEPKKAQPAADKTPLWDTYRMLTGKKFVDMTHPFQPGIPKWSGFPDEKRKKIYTYARDGFSATKYTFVGQWGTHVDPPSHFHEGLRSLDDIPVREMVAPLVVINISSRAAEDPDARLTVDDVRAWETKYGRIPPRAFVVKRDDWGKRWPDNVLMQNSDVKGRRHFPGWSVDALKFLVLERNIVAIGHETTDTDPGITVSDDRYPAETYILGENRYQIELLANVDELPEYGGLAFITFPRPVGGTGFPARVFAIVP